MDPSAYTDSATWHKILSELNLDEVDIRDNRYDCVVHLVTAAKGAEQFYTLENNSARTEGLELARTLDDAVMKAWMGHSSLQVVDNFSVKNFQEKKNRVVQAVLSRLGLTEHTVSGQIKKYKYVVRGYKYEDKDFPVDYRDFNVEHTYLIDTRSDGSQIRVRRREEANSSIVHLNVVTRHAEIDGQRIETRRTLAQREYDFLRTQADPTRHTVGKHRRCFLWKDRSFQLDTFLKPHPGLVLLETYLESDTLSTINGNGEESMIPPWLDVVEVTNDKKYSMYELSKKDN
ncbi:hypothetical protein HK098_000803 [Nowakowskiella sp. JEL0407]|nr:hypothetical protein HK098_000803 [Nowakowskiella sp. JEL0407]